MPEREIRLLEESFKKYYFDRFDLIHIPEKPPMREFGYQKFSSGMIRHLTIKDDKELRLMIMRNVPSDIYCSNGYYSFPNLPMAEKDWQGADLIFDIDAKDLNLPCRPNHIVHKCVDCNKTFHKDSLCPNCGSSKHNSKSFPCSICIDGAKKEVEKLSQILIEDLGVDEKSIHVYFSGNEGFHVYVHDINFQKLGSRERNELVDYMMFRGAIPETFGMKKSKPNRSSFCSFEEKGWRGRVSKEIFGSKSRRSKIITQIMNDGYQSFARQLEQISTKIGANIDPNVTTDIHRIFRLPGSLNSKSGLAKVFCEDLKQFNPYTDSCFIDDTKTQVIANLPFEFKLKNEKFGPYNEESVSMPRFAAVYMICKGLASVV